MSRVDTLLRPESIAIVGASPTMGSVGRRTLDALRHFGFPGLIFCVNPRYSEIEGLPCYPDLDAIPGVPDLVIVAVPAGDVPVVVEQSVACGARNAVIFSAGFTGPRGIEAGAWAREAARLAEITVLGPSTSGFINFWEGTGATFADVHEGIATTQGGLAVISQSGGVASLSTALAAQHGLGMSLRIVTGNEWDVGVPEVLEYVARDERTERVLLFFEGVRDGRALRAACQAVAEADKALVVIKAGVSPAAAAIAGTHTGHIVGSDSVYDALFARSGAIRAGTPQEAVDILAVTSVDKRLRHTAVERPSVGAISVSGGEAAIMADEFDRRDLRLPCPGPHTAAALIETLEVPTISNPIDLTAQSGVRAGMIRAVASRVLRDPVYDFVVASFAHRALVPRHAEAILAELTGLGGDGATPLIVTGLMRQDVRERLQAEGYLTFDGPGRAIDAIAAVGSVAPPQRDTVHAANQDRRGHSRDAGTNRLIAGAQALALAEAGGVPLVDWRVADSITAVQTIGMEIGFPLVLKSDADGLIHRTDEAAVVTKLRDLQELEAAYIGLTERLAHRIGAQRVVMQRQVGEASPELLVSGYRDATFGDVICLGVGGTLSELDPDFSVCLADDLPGMAPVMVSRLRQRRALAGFRGMTKVSDDSLSVFLMAIRDFLRDHDDVGAIELNPVMVDEGAGGLLAVDCVIEGGWNGNGA